MRKTIHIFTVIIASSILTCSCVKEQFEKIEVATPDHSEIHFENQINPVSIGKQEIEEDLPPYATKSLVSAQTTRHLKTNFLRIDEIQENNLGTYTYPSWENGYVLEASVISSPGNLQDAYMRSVFLQPVQTYKITVTPKEDGTTEDNDTTFYHTRMISWHPITCRLRKVVNPNPNRKDSIASVQQLNHFIKKNVGYDAFTAGDQLQLNFRDLDGTKDVMVSEIREGQHWHSKLKKEGPKDTWKVFHPESDGPDGALYREPFGRNEINPEYNNCFQYKHFMSAVRVYAYADKEVQNASMWGEIQKVIVRNQPKEASITIPAFDESHPNARNYGTFTPGSAMTLFPLQKGNIYGDDTNTDQNQTVNEHITLEGTTIDNAAYLGYALIAPNTDLVLDIHTDSGIYSVTVNTQQDDNKKIFDSGYIYDVTLNFGTQGTIAAMLLKDAGGNYLDLTTGEKYTSEGSSSFIYKTANCYMVDPTAKYDGTHYYDGYTFLATTMGNGAKGLLPEFNIPSTQLDKPVYAGLIWESRLGLVTQVEFMYDYIRFKIQKPADDKNFEEGNAVIGVYNKDQKLLWSWHIWITDKVQDIKLNENTFIQDRNLGAIASDPSKEDPLNTYGLYYQWGRKDPSMGANRKDYSSLSSECDLYYDYYGNKLNSTSVVFKDNPSIQDGIDNPMYLIFPSQLPAFYPYNWLSKRINNLWGETAQDKTIFDPCPFGYMVPSTEIKDYIKGHEYNYNIKNNAISFENDKVWFPLAGFKGVDRGISSLTASWKYVGKKGDYMSRNIHQNDHRTRVYLSEAPSWEETGADRDVDEGPHNKEDTGIGGDGYGDGKHIYKSHFTYDYTNRRTAASIRCVKQEFAIKGSVYAEFTVPFPKFMFLGDTFNYKYSISTEYTTIGEIKFTEKTGEQETTLVHHVYPDNEIKDKTQYTGEGEITYAKNAYDQIGKHTFTLLAENDRGVQKTVTATSNVLPEINIANVMIGTTPVTSTQVFNKSSLGRQDFSFTLLTRENQSLNEDMELLNQCVKFYVNGIEMNYADGRYTTSKKSNLPKDKYIIECRDGSNVLKRFEMDAEYKTGQQILKVNSLVNGYYAFCDPENTAWWWIHNGGQNKLARSAPSNGYLHYNNIFNLTMADSGNNNWKEYNIQFYSSDEYLQNDLTAGENKQFGFFNKDNQQLGFYVASGDKAIQKSDSNSNLIINNNRHSWKSGDGWYVYPVDVNKVYYHDPVETTL